MNKEKNTITIPKGVDVFDELTKILMEQFSPRTKQFLKELDELAKKENTKCTDCEGTGIQNETENLSQCCGAESDSDYEICSECKEHTELGYECETCNGSGEVKNGN